MVVQNGFAKWFGCTKWLYKMIVHNSCTKWLCIMVVQNGCAKWVYRIVEHNIIEEGFRI